jgi:dTDP-glucose 4,6-dehydratase
LSKNYIVTGGAGFIGSNFILYLLEKYKDIKILNLDKLTYAGNPENLKQAETDARYGFVQADIADEEAVNKVFKEYNPDIVINFAAESHVDRSITNPGIFARTNVIGTVNLLNASLKLWQEGGGFRRGAKFLQVSTDEVYGALGTEGYFTEETPLSPHSPYSASKASADFFVKAYADTYGLPVNITRCSNNYGPFQFPEKFIPLIINNVLCGREVPVFGDGMQVRDWLYVGDHCKAICMVADRARPGEIYNVGGHNERYNIDIAKQIIAYIGQKTGANVDEKLIRHVTDRKGHDRRYAIDPAKIKRNLGWEPDTPFEEGIAKTIDWYLNNGGWMERVSSGAYKEYYDKMYMNR